VLHVRDSRVRRCPRRAMDDRSGCMGDHCCDCDGLLRRSRTPDSRLQSDGTPFDEPTPGGRSLAAGRINSRSTLRLYTYCPRRQDSQIGRLARRPAMTIASPPMTAMPPPMFRVDGMTSAVSRWFYLALALGACAALANTPEQNLAYERWAQCSRPSVTLQSISVDGEIAFFYTTPADRRDVVQCLSD